MLDGTLTLEVDDVKLCNCSCCGQELLGESMERLVSEHGRKTLPNRYRRHCFVYTRHAGRPLCQECWQQTEEDK